MFSKATLSHLTAIFREERRYFVLGRELASIGFGQAVFNVLHLPRLHLQIFPQSLDRQETFCSTGRFRQRFELGRDIKRKANIERLLSERYEHDSWPHGRGLQKVFYTYSVRISTANQMKDQRLGVKLIRAGSSLRRTQESERRIDFRRSNLPLNSPQPVNAVTKIVSRKKY